MKKYLITGGCGFVGSNIAARLLNQGQKVVLFDNLSRTGSQDNLTWLQSFGEPFFYQGDTSDDVHISQVIKTEKPEVIFHLAGQVAMTTSVANPMRDFKTNVEGSVNLLEAVRFHSPDTVLLYSSSNKVYGALAGVRLVERELRYEAPDFPEGIAEDAPLDFRTPYGCSKGAADQYFLEYARTYGLKTAVFRHSTIYGGRQHSTYDQGWVGWFCRQALDQQKNPATSPFTISGDGKQVRDLLYVDDAVECYLAAAEKIDKIAGQPFNIGGGAENSSSLLELFDLLERKLGIRLNYVRREWRHEDQRFFVADNARMRSSTGWSPIVSREAGVARILEWVKGR
ncbi:MAG: NAD-dependent epimerase/dehydratase family protein [bacterium]